MAWFGGEKKRLELWRTIAQERGGVFHEISGPFYSRTTPAIEVPYEPEGAPPGTRPARVYMDTHTVSTGQTTITYTRVRARLVPPVGPVFRVYKEGVFSTLGKALGFQDVTLGGHPAFDDAFMVKTKAAEATTAIWTLPAKELLLAHLQGVTVTCDGQELLLQVMAVLDNRPVIEAALDVIGELAAADIFGLAALVSLPKTRFTPSTGPWEERTLPYVQVSAMVPTLIAPAAQGDSAVTKAWATPVVTAYDCAITVGDKGELEGDSAQIPESARSALGRVGPGSLTVAEGRAEFTWLGIETGQERLLAGAELVAAFATAPSTGAFR